MKTTKTDHFIKGIITPIEWGPDGVVAETAIAGIDGRNYEVVQDQLGRQLAAYARQGVAASGEIMSAENDRLQICIRAFNILGPVVDWDLEAT